MVDMMMMKLPRVSRLASLKVSHTSGVPEMLARMRNCLMAWSELARVRKPVSWIARFTKSRSRPTIPLVAVATGSSTGAAGRVSASGMSSTGVAGAVCAVVSAAGAAAGALSFRAAGSLQEVAVSTSASRGRMLEIFMFGSGLRGVGGLTAARMPPVNVGQGRVS